MARKASGVPKQKPPRPLNVATHLPSDDEQLFTHCSAGWEAVKADPAHFPAPPVTAELDPALTTLGTALKAAPNGAPTDKAAVKTAAVKVRNLWGQLAKYVQTCLRAMPVEDTLPILANVLMYKSDVGAHAPKPPLAAKHGPTSGTAVVTALAILHALTYGFEWSLDQLTWSTTTSGQARTTFTGLAPGKMYWFRVRAFLRDGTTTDYVHPVSLTMI
jgi:hypothetical protein